MKSLSREQLIETYIVAKREGLADMFIQLIEKELQDRHISLEKICTYELNDKKYYMN